MDLKSIEISVLWDECDSLFRELNQRLGRGEFSEDTGLQRAAGSSYLYVLDPVGLLLIRPLESGGCLGCPINSISFAATGGAGVTFSFVLLEEVSLRDCPIVMTIPLGPFNVIVGANLHEFLSLGMYRGYFSLEFLIGLAEEYVQYYSCSDFSPDHGEGDRWMLKRLAEVLDLQPWMDVRSRLNHLQRVYSPMLIWDDEESGDCNVFF